MRLAYELGLRVLGPNVEWLMIKALLAGVLLKFLSIGPGLAFAAVLCVFGALGDHGESEFEALITPLSVIAVLLIAPISETILLSLVFGIVTRLAGFHAWISGIIVTSLAVVGHDYDLLGRLVIGFLCAAMSWQYVLHRKYFTATTSVTCVAITQAPLMPSAS